MFLINPAPVKVDDSPDLCRCGDCYTEFKVEDCDSDHGHHDGWEMPAYTEILCSVCDDGGCIDDFYYSPAKIEMLKAMELT